MNQQRPPWREPMVWLIVALPLASVIASGLLIFNAIRSGGDDAVADTVRRTAQIQVSDLGPDTLASRRQLSVVLLVEDGQLRLLPVSGEFERKQPLRLSLRHPTRADADQVLLLLPDAGGWRAGRVLDRDHDWKLEVAAVDGSWRIQGRLPRGQRAARLAPVLEPP